MLDAFASAAAGPPFDPDAVPREAVVSSDRRLLTLRLPDGSDVVCDAAGLRAACRCAWCTRARIDGVFPQSVAGVAIEELSLVGGYALNIAFSDGHARGIYPFAWLRTLAGASAGAVPPSDSTSPKEALA